MRNSGGDSMKKKLFLLIYLISPLTLTYMMAVLNPGLYGSMKSITALLLGMTAYTWLGWQFIFSSRPKWLEKVLGLDFLLRLHGIMALFIILFGFLHGQIKESMYPESFTTQIGSFSIILMIVISIFSVLIMVQTKLHHLPWIKKIHDFLKNKHILTYESTKKLHNLFVVVMLLVVMHVLLAIKSQNSFMIFSIIMMPFLLAISHYMYHKVVKPWINSGLTLKAVSLKIHEISGGQEIFEVKLKSNQSLQYAPGQFAYFKFKKGASYEEHPFTISSAPQDKEIGITFKTLGDFTKAVNTSILAHPIYIDGPYGMFSYKAHPNEKSLVMLAAGIGITPMLSMIKSLQYEASEMPVHLIWQLRYSSDAFAQNELNDLLSTMHNFRVTIYLSKENELTESYSGIHYKNGKADLTEIIKHQEKHDTGYYICGPGSYMDACKKNLIKHKISTKHIHMEKFSF